MIVGHPKAADEEQDLVGCKKKTIHKADEWHH